MIDPTLIEMWRQYASDAQFTDSTEHGTAWYVTQVTPPPWFVGEYYLANVIWASMV